MPHEDFPNLKVAKDLLTDPSLLNLMTERMLKGEELYEGYYPLDKDSLEDTTEEVADASNYISIEIAKTPIFSTKFPKLVDILKNLEAIYVKVQNVRNS